MRRSFEYSAARVARAEISFVGSFAVTCFRVYDFDGSFLKTTRPFCTARLSAVVPNAGATAAKSFCLAWYAALRTAGVIEPAVTLPPELGPMGKRVSPIRM